MAVSSSPAAPGKMPGNLGASWVEGPKPRVSADGAWDELSSYRACPSPGWGCRSSLAGTLASPHPILTQPVGPHRPHASRCVWTGTGQDPACRLPVLPSSRFPGASSPGVQRFLRPHVFLAKKRSKESFLEAWGEEKGRLTDGDSLPSGRLCICYIKQQVEKNKLWKCMRLKVNREKCLYSQCSFHVETKIISSVSGYIKKSVV